MPKQSGLQKRPALHKVHAVRKAAARQTLSKRPAAAASTKRDAARALRVFTTNLDAAAHDRMGMDDARMGAYTEAIQRAVPGRTVLDLGTGPHALLALLCARAGAKRVIAVEVVPAAAALARKAVAASGLSEQVVVLEGHSALLTLPRVDMVVHEIVGNIATEEGVAAALADLQGRPEVVDSHAVGWSLPLRVETWCAPTNLSVPLDMNGNSPKALSNAVRLPFTVPQGALLGDPQPMEAVETDCAIRLEQVRTLKWEVTSSSTLAGIICAPRLVLDAQTVVNAWQQKTHWHQVLVLLSVATLVDPGDVVELIVESSLRNFPVVHRFEAAVIRRQSGRRTRLKAVEVKLR
mmetsp:Transcript_126759/g.253413  ORF Transcript_126759/g.253413 Transcript_126759/m.253413 type:complete len:350 (+) Transcript_126759:44-1093(+)